MFPARLPIVGKSWLSGNLTVATRLMHVSAGGAHANHGSARCSRAGATAGGRTEMRLWRVGDETAKTAALAFYDATLRDGKVLPAFSAMLASIKNPLYRDIYILWGLHFTTFP